MPLSLILVDLNQLFHKMKEPISNRNGFFLIVMLLIYALTFPFTFAITSSAIPAGAGA